MISRVLSEARRRIEECLHDDGDRGTYEHVREEIEAVLLAIEELQAKLAAPFPPK